MLALVLLASWVLQTASIGNFTFVMLPGQSFYATPCNGCPPDGPNTFVVGQWGESQTCVVQTNGTGIEGSKPFALLYVDGHCPVGAIFDIKLATADRQRPWNPYPADADPKRLVFTPAVGFESDPKCENDPLAVANRIAFNKGLAALRPGDVFTVPQGTHCMAAGIVGSRLSHVTLDIQGEIRFAQHPDHWSNASTGKYANGILLQGLTNVTITSSTRTGLIKSNGCIHWYYQRLAHKVRDPPPLFEVSADPELTFASSKIVWEHMAVEDGPNWQTYWHKVTDLTIRYVRVDITCIPPIGTITNMLGALALNTDGIDIWGSNVWVHDVEITNADDCVCVKGDDLTLTLTLTPTLIERRQRWLTYLERELDD